MQQYRLQDLRKEFALGQIAVNGVDLAIGKGERVAFIGPSGAGKTTLFRMLNCTLRPTAGRLWIDGEDTSCLHGKRLRQVRRRIGTIYQQHNLVPRLKVVHNVLAGKLGSWSLGRSLISLMRPSDIDLAHEALSRVGIAEKIFSRTDELSGGQQQRVAIARVLVQDPEVILADEPVSSVDPTLAMSILNLLLNISEETRKTLLVNLHSTHLALSFFSRIIGIKGGATLFDSSPREVTEETLAQLYAGDFQPNGFDQGRNESLNYACR